MAEVRDGHERPAKDANPPEVVLDYQKATFPGFRRVRRIVRYLVVAILCLIIGYAAFCGYIDWKYSETRLRGLTEQQVRARLGSPYYRSVEGGDVTIGYGDVFGFAYEIRFKKGRVTKVLCPRADEFP